jgi:aryl-alcohol dehydrogenase-like predicted oxidoreductase
MQEINLGATGRQTTRLGYGCSSLMGGMGRKESLAVLETAFDAGIRHFDVAPLYGYGEAEGCLGEFLRRHPGHVTVTTKYGIPPANSRSLMSVARNAARPIVRLLPGLKQRMASVAAKVTPVTERASFTAAQAKESLDRSLANLRVDRIDAWLLHEVEAQDLNDDALLRLLEDQVAAGIIGTFGIGSEAAKVGELLRQRPEYCPTLQYEWSVLDAKVAPTASFRIHHRTLTNNFRSLHAALLEQPAVCRRWSHEAGVDLSDAELLAKLMLKASLEMNPESIILFSSRRPEHIHANVAVADDAKLAAPAQRLYHLVQAEQHDLLRTVEAAVSR